MGIVANGSGKAMFKEYEESGETIMTPLWKNGTILGAGFIKRSFINMAIALQNNRRALIQMQALYPLEPLKFEKLLK